MYGETVVKIKIILYVEYKACEKFSNFGYNLENLILKGKNNSKESRCNQEK
jgi:hypothetical protein